MRRRDFLGVSLAAAAVLTSCRKTGGTGSNEQRRRIRIAQWGQEKYLIYLPFYLAQATGALSRQGLETELSFSGNDDQVFAAVLRGDADFGIGDPTFAAIAQARGGDGVVVGAIVDKVALWGIAAKGAPRRDAPGDFAKARVGSFPRPSTTYTLLKQMADSQHVRGMTIVEVPIGSEVALLESGRADVVMMLEPAASRAVRQGYEIVTSFPRLWGPFAFTGMTSTRRFTSSNPDVVVKLRAGMQEALSLAHSDRGRTTSIAQSLFPSLEKEVVATAVARMLDDQTVPLSFEPTREGWHRATETRIAMGQLPAGEYSGTLLAGS